MKGDSALLKGPFAPGENTAAKGRELATYYRRVA